VSRDQIRAASCFILVTTALGLCFPLQAQSKLPEGKGKALVERECAKCHGLEGVVSARMTRERWSDLVDDMVSRGATGTDQEIDQIIDYLATNFAKGAANTKSGVAAKINVNRANTGEIAAVLEIPEQKASSIVRYREQHGSFKDLDELKKVPDIDVKRLDEKKDRLEF
jgi:competence protein ComEA